MIHHRCAVLQKIQSALSNPIILGNLVFRFLLLVFVLYSDRWHCGDTHHYLGNAINMCKGFWGGDNAKPPFYGWYLCGLMPGVSLKPSMLEVALPLALQTFSVWLAGVFFWSSVREVRSRTLIAACWFFDPVILLYSHLVMSDALFAVFILVLSMTLWKFFQGLRSKFILLILGFELGIVILSRSVGFPLAWFTLLFIEIILFFDSRISIKQKLVRFALPVVMLGITVSPLLYWNVTNYNRWSLVTQDQGWLQSVAAAVEYHGQGLDYFQSEQKWWNEHRKPEEVWDVLKNKYGLWFFLTAKGVARVVLGHTNVEAGYLLTGQSPIGPGWFKVPEERSGPHVTGWLIIPWVLGIVLVLIYCLWVYKRTLCAFYNSSSSWKSRMDCFTVWLMSASFLLAFIPQIWGDSRFRAPVWSLILILWMYSESRVAKQNGKIQ